jgi:hypothetical protein
MAPQQGLELSDALALVARSKLMVSANIDSWTA